MEPDAIALVVSAIALGAEAGVKETAALAVKDAYSSLRQVLRRKRIDVPAVEDPPQSSGKRESLQESLARVVDDNDELLSAAQDLVEQVRLHDRAAAEVVGVDLERVRAQFLRIRGLKSAGSGVRVRDASFEAGIDIEDIQSGSAGNQEDPRTR